MSGTRYPVPVYDPRVPRADVQRIDPRAVLPGGRIMLSGSGFDVRPGVLPQVEVGGAAARVVRGSSRQLVIEVPADTPGGRQPLAVEGLDGATVFVDVGVLLTSGVHQVDSPVYDTQGRLYATLSGQRGQQTPVSVFRVGRDGTREPLVTGLGNATSLAVGPDGHVYVSSRFEGTVSRISDTGEVERFAENLGVAFGMAFDREGRLYVGDRSGTIHRVESDGRASAFAMVPSSVAAFHLAMAPDGILIVSAPTLNSSDGLYRISPGGDTTRWAEGFGRPQGLAFDRQGTLHVVDALAGDSGVYRVDDDGTRTLVVSGPGLLGVTFDPTDGTLTACTDDAIYRIPQ
jgi:sugar lactone lactonase YvrE